MKWSARTAATTLTGTETVGIIQSGADKRTTVADIRQSAASGYLTIESFGAVGDGSTDDTVAVQAALTYASTYGATILLTPGATYKVVPPLFLWGRCCLESWQTDTLGFGQFDIVGGSIDYVFSFGISALLTEAQEWSGMIRKVAFNVVSGTGTRILFFFRTNGGLIEYCTATVGESTYSLTSSGNNNSWLSGASNYIRRNITIRGCTVTGTGDTGGSEGIGINAWDDGVLIEGNTIIGMSDDPIAVHFSQNIIVRNNTCTSVDGRLFFSSPVGLQCIGNTHTRCVQGQAGTFAAGAALIAVQFESTAANAHYAPENILIADNLLIHPDGSIDNGGGVILLSGVRQCTVSGNTILNQSSSLVSTNGVICGATTFSGTWTDPTGLDVTDVARVRNVSIVGNSCAGAYPLAISQTGTGANFLGSFVVANNFCSRTGLYAAVTAENHNTNGTIYAQAYSASITPDASRPHTEITVTDGNAFTINSPTNNAPNTVYTRGLIFIITITNASGGAMGTITWNTNFKLAGAFTNPATSTQRSIAFVSEGTIGASDRFRELWRTAADVVST